MRTDEVEYPVPERLIPTRPRELRGGRRGDGRLVVLDRARERIEHAQFRDLKSWLDEGDALVVNNSLVMHDRLAGECAHGKVSLILFAQHPDGWLAQFSPARLARRGRVIRVGGGEVRALLLRPDADDLWVVRFEF